MGDMEGAGRERITTETQRRGGVSGLLPTFAMIASDCTAVCRGWKCSSACLFAKRIDVHITLEAVHASREEAKSLLDTQGNLLASHTSR